MYKNEPSLPLSSLPFYLPPNVVSLEVEELPRTRLSHFPPFAFSSSWSIFAKCACVSGLQSHWAPAIIIIIKISQCAKLSLIPPAFTKCHIFSPIYLIQGEPGFFGASIPHTKLVETHGIKVYKRWGSLMIFCCGFANVRLWRIIQ